MAFLNLLSEWVRRDFRVRYTQTLLGSFWAIFQPVAFTAAFVFLFRSIAPIGVGVDYAVFAYTGMLLWIVFSNGLTMATNAMGNSMYIATKAAYPRVVAPISGAMLSLVDFGIGLLLWPLLLLSRDTTPSVSPGPVVLAIIGTLAFTAGLGTMLSALTIFVRDIKTGLPLVLPVALIATPVAYPVDRVPRAIADWNPIATFVTGFRSGLLGLAPPDGTAWLRATVVTVATLAVGFAYFRAVESRFSDVA